MGRRGEDLAAALLQARGMRIIERNWRCRYGEIDIIAEDVGGEVVFCEVKCRAGRGFGDPLESITTDKLGRLRCLCGRWLAEHPTTADIRLDAIGIILRRGYLPDIMHVRGIG